MFIQYVFPVKNHVFQSTFLQAFSFTTSFLEEFFKWFILYFTIYQHVEFDEHYDGIAYGAAVSLGFTTAENTELYLFANGLESALGRAFYPYLVMLYSASLWGII